MLAAQIIAAIMQIIENRAPVRAPEAARVQLSVSGFPFGSNLGPAHADAP